jgi:hypothetical protein
LSLLRQRSREEGIAVTGQSEPSEVEARAAVLEARSQYLDSSDDAEVGSILSEDLVGEMLDLAWLHQFSDDRTVVQRAIREVVSDRVTQVIDLEGGLG